MNTPSITSPPVSAPSRRSALSAWLSPPVIVLTAALATFGALGLAGVGPWDSWPMPARWALAAMFLLTASARLGPRRAGLIPMVPRVLPKPALLVAITGALEALGAVGLVVPTTAPVAAWSLAVLLVAMFPANVQAAQHSTSIGDRAATPLGIRTVHQVAFVALAIASAY